MLSRALPLVLLLFLVAPRDAQAKLGECSEDEDECTLLLANGKENRVCCLPGKRCTPDGCVSPGLPNCSEDADCPSKRGCDPYQRVCKCDASPECGGAATCEAFMCVTKCSSDMDCVDGDRCLENGRCGPAGCSSSLDCGEGLVCTFLPDSSTYGYCSAPLVSQGSANFFCAMKLGDPSRRPSPLVFVSLAALAMARRLREKRRA